MNPRDEYVKNAEVLDRTREMIDCFRRQNHNRGNRLFRKWTQDFSLYCELFFADKMYFNEFGEVVNEISVISTLQEILYSQEQNDYIFMADLLELKILPFLLALQNVIRLKGDNLLPLSYLENNLIYMESAQGNGLQLKKEDIDILRRMAVEETFDAEHYRIEDTEIGFPTLKVIDEKGEYYLHSNYDPKAEAREVAREYFKEELESYTVYGLGLAYHIEALSKMCDGAYPIEVFESDFNIVYAALTSQNFIPLMKNGVSIHYDPKFSMMAKRLKNKPEGLMIYYPSIRSITEKELKKQITEVFIYESSIRNRRSQMMSNFRYNIQNCPLYVDSIREKVEGKRVFLIAAGPSLDRNIIQLLEYFTIGTKEILSARKEDNIIIAVGTVYKKLMKLGLKPDYVVFLDANSQMLQQVSGYEQQDVSMLIISTAWREIAMLCGGKKYLICQEDYPPAEKYAAQNGYHLYQTGGSVATIAFDVAIYMGARQIICMGLDLAYTNQKMHAVDTSHRELASTDDLITLPSAWGEKVYSSVVFDIYRKWFEKRIQNEKSSNKFINATEGGAYIEGMKHISLREVLDSK